MNEYAIGLSATHVIIAVTCIVYLVAPPGSAAFEQYKHWPWAESRRKEYQRWITAGFLHANWAHLLFNMFTLYFFGPLVESWFREMYPTFGGSAFTLFYIAAMIAASVGTYIRHRDNPSFASIGASGAVAGMLFAAILFQPTIGIMLFFIPIPIPGFLFGILYLWYSSYAARNSADNIDHLAHFYGAIFGFCAPALFQPYLLYLFFAQLTIYITNLF